MSKRVALGLFALSFAILACGLPAAAPPTAFPELPTPDFQPLPLATSPAPAPTAASAATPFTGTWIGPDPDDGSSMTLTLVQSGSSLTGTYIDSYSGSIQPPGFQGTVAGTASSATTGTLTLNVQRHDGVSLNLLADLSLSAAQDVLTVTVTSAGASPWTLRRQ